MNAQNKQRRDMQQACDEWNNTHPVGTLVYLKKDDGRHLITRTRSSALVSEAGYPVIWLEGIPGYYLLTSVSPVEGQVRPLSMEADFDPVAAIRLIAALVIAAGGSIRVPPVTMQQLRDETRVGVVKSIDGAQTFYIEKL